jgi:hypothetical protein
VPPGFDVRLFGFAMAAQEGVDLGYADAHFSWRDKGGRWIWVWAAFSWLEDIVPAVLLTLARCRMLQLSCLFRFSDDEAESPSEPR